MKSLAAVMLLVGCSRPGEQRAVDELAVGAADFPDVSVQVDGGLAAVRDLSDHHLALWAEAPVLDVTMTVGQSEAGTHRVVIENAMPGAFIRLDDATTIVQVATDERPTVATFDVPLTDGPHRLHVAPPDADVIETFRVAAMADIQTALPVVDDVFHAIDAVPDARFVVGMGDLTQRAEESEYDEFELQLGELDIPFYTTLGNHELWTDPQNYMRRFGRPSFQFWFKGAAFTYVDSGDTGLDPLVDEWLDGWLEQAKDKLSLFMTHVPPIDPVGMRDGSFRSAEDGHRLLEKLARNNVDLTLYGHIHTYVAFENAGIRAYISGGGGAIPVAWDGIDRHFLVVSLSPQEGTVGEVEVHRVADRE